MAHFAKLDSNQKVVEIIVIDNEMLRGLQFPHSEPAGQKYIFELGLSGNWLQTSYNGNFRNKYAGIGYSYNRKLDAFVPPAPYASWIFNVALMQWQAPTPCPTDDALYMWNEDLQTWTAAPTVHREVAIQETQLLANVGQLPPALSSNTNHQTN